MPTTPLPTAGLSPNSPVPSFSPLPSDISHAETSVLEGSEGFSVVEEGILQSTDYARRCKELMGLHASLTALGAGNLIDLPRIVVIGGQSAGKSSLVEAVSGISVPRDSGTCTRCPMECTMSPSVDGSWSCSISLRFDYDSFGVRDGSPKIDEFCSHVTDKASVDLWLRRAQLAILSPHKSPADFAKMSLDDLRYSTRLDSKVLAFSRNTICVDIKDPEATNLSFLDLPGLMQNESETSIKLVRNLVEDNIGGVKSDNTLILVTIPMSDDMENQQAVLLARVADPQGLRTIGVLTKPDMLTSGALHARRKWKGLLEGTANQHALKLGYYCVRLSNDEERERGISRSEAQAIAKDFFETTSPWSEFESRERFGIPGFVNYISGHLVEMIEKNLPKLKEDVDNQLEKCHKMLLGLPLLATKDATTEILLRVTMFCAGLTAAVAGDQLKDLTHKNRELYHQFKLAIRRTAPDFRPFRRHVDYLPVLYPDEDDEDDSEPTAGGPGPLDLTYVKGVIKGSITWELPDHVPFEATKFLILQITKQWQSPVMTCFEGVFSNVQQAVDSLLKTHFETYKHLHSHVSNLVTTKILACKEEALRTLTKMLTLESVPIFTQNLHYLDSKGKLWLRQYTEVYHDRDSRYQAAPRTTTAQPARVLFGDSFYTSPSPSPPAPSQIAGDGSPSTPNTNPVAAKKKKKTSSSDKTPLGFDNLPVMFKPRSSSSEEHERNALESLHLGGHRNVTMDDLSSILTPHEHREELLIMAKVRAYFDVAYKRIIDYIPLAIEHELNQALANQLQESLFRDLIKEPKERLEELLCEDPVIATRRRFLQGRVRTLGEMRLKLANFRRESVV